MSESVEQNRGTPAELLLAGRQIALKKDAWSDFSVEQIVQKILDLFGLDIPNWQEIIANFDELRRAIEGTYTGNDMALNAIQSVIGTIRKFATGLIDPSRLPLIPFSHIGESFPNLLENGGFDGAESLDGQGIWTWDGAEGHTKPGSARATGDGTRKVLLSNSVAATPGQKFDFSGWVKWSDVSGGMGSFRVSAVAYSGNAVVETKTVSNIDSPVATKTWTEMTGTYEVPTGADNVRVQVEIGASVTAGTIWWDDMKVSKYGTVPQRFVNGLIDALGDLGNGITVLVTRLGDLLDKITGVVGSTIGDIQQWFAQLKSILAGGNPLNVFPTLAGQTIGTLNQMLNQIGQLFQGVVVTPINGVVQGVKDWLFDLLGWKTNTSSNHQSLKDNVWSGATQNGSEVVTGKTDEQIRQAVAALRARAEESKAAMEMEFLSAFPIWQGLIPGGEVTIPLQMLNADSPSIGLGYTMTLFRPRNSFSIEKISFIAGVGSSTNPGTWTAARLLLMSYNEDTNQWTCVDRTNDFKSQLGNVNSWIHASLETGYTPRVGEDMAIVAKPYAPDLQGFGVASFSNDTTSPFYTIPTSTLHPRGGMGTISGASTVVNVGDSFSSDDVSKITWTNGVMPFYHYSPDLGQVETFPSLYWFDDFNMPLSTGSRYKLLTNTSNSASISTGKLEYSGTTDGRQGLIYTTPMNTDFMSVQADVVYDAVNYGETTCSVIGLHQNINGIGGVHLTIDRTAGGSVVLRTGGSLSSPITGTTVRASIMSGHNPEGRWQLFWDEPTLTYRVVHNGVGLGALTWADPSNSIGRGKVRRYTMLTVGRSSFQDSLGWDNLLIQDIT